MILITTNFGFAAWLAEIKKYELILNSKTEGIKFNIPDNIFPQELKQEYYNSKYNFYNKTLRNLIYEFKNSK